MPRNNRRKMRDLRVRSKIQVSFQLFKRANYFQAISLAIKIKAVNYSNRMLLKRTKPQNLAIKTSNLIQNPNNKAAK